MNKQEYLFERLNAVEMELEEFEKFSTSIEILVDYCNEQIEAELFTAAENLLAELENLVISFRQSKGK